MTGRIIRILTHSVWPIMATSVLVSLPGGPCSLSADDQPTSGVAGAAVAEVAVDFAKAQKHWAFQSPRHHPLPTVKRAHLVKTAIDNFVLAKLEEHGLEPSSLADKRTLIRRATFDLIGLPPSAEEVEAFLEDDAPEAFANVVDRLLDSPHYGERWGRYWLDAARYADTKGYVYSDREERRFVHSYAYRDWVIGAFNQDLPYDQFLIQQIAGDQLSAAGDRSHLAAMGFLTVGRRFAGNVYEIIDDRIDTLCRATMALTVSCARCHDHKYDPIPTQDYYALYGVFGGSIEQRTTVTESPAPTESYVAYEQELQQRQRAFDDALRTKSEQLLNRVRLRTEEYLVAVLDVEKLATENVYEILGPDDLNPVLVRQWQNYLLATSGEFHPIFAAWHALAAMPGTELAGRFASWLDRNRDRLNPRVVALFAESAPASMRELAERYGKLFAEVHTHWQNALKAATESKREVPTALPDAADEALRQVLYGPGSPVHVPAGPINEIEWCFDEPTRVELGALQMKIDQWIIESAAAPSQAVYLIDRPIQQNPRVFRRGNPATKGDEVPRQFLAVLAGPERRPFRHGSGRLELAQAIASADNPLVARVLVNRVWMHHFGSSLVATPSDFGLRSEPPTHPELLDWLARRFIADGWSIKKLHRLIMLSRTYQQASDPDALALVAAASAGQSSDSYSPEGVIANDVGSPTASALRAKLDPENRLMWRMNRRRLDFEALCDSVLAVSGQLDTRVGGKPELVSEQSPGRRRAVYRFIDRLNVPDVFRTFDVASPDVHSPQRHMTTVPQQSLYMLNSPFLVEQARRLANRPEVMAAATTAGRIDRLYRIVFGRPATAREQSLGAQLSALPIAEAVVQKPSVWQYGYGPYDAAAQRLKLFVPLPYFSGGAWQGGSALPDPALGRAMLSATGGHAGSVAEHTVVRRWIAPESATVNISGSLAHKREGGDGVRARIVSSRSGELASWSVCRMEAETKIKGIEVSPDDTLDFLVDCRGDALGDEFLWAPVIRRADAPEPPAAAQPGTEWHAALDFRGPTPAPLNPWEKYVQVLLLTNEFMFVD